MKYFNEAIAASGESVSGTTTAESLADAIVQLQGEGLEVLSIQQQSVAARSILGDATLTKVQAVDGVTDEKTSERYDAMTARLQAVAADLPQGRPRRELSQLILAMQQRMSMDDLVEKSPEWATLLISSTLRPDQDGAALSEFIDRLLHRDDDRKAMWQVLLYPALVLGLALSVLVLFCWWVIPEFGAMFNDFGMRLPAPTRVLLRFSQTLQANPLGALLGCLAVVVVPCAVIWFWVRLRLTSKLFGYVPIKNRPSGLASLTGQVASLLDAGLPLDEALRLFRCREQPYYEDIAGALVRHLRTRTNPPTGFLPPNVMDALGFAGNVDGVSQPNADMLRSLSRLYRSRIGPQDSWWLGAASGLAMLGTGFMVAWVVFSLFLPMISLLGGLS